jgi:hypothetical protein
MTPVKAADLETRLINGVIQHSSQTVLGDVEVTATSPAGVLVDVVKANADAVGCIAKLLAVKFASMPLAKAVDLETRLINAGIQHSSQPILGEVEVIATSPAGVLVDVVKALADTVVVIAKALAVKFT